MIKKDIVKVKAGKGVQKSAEYCGMSVFYKAAEKCAAGNARKREFEHQKRRKLTVKKLKAKKTYYFKVRAYKKNGKQKLFGTYSKVLRVKM